MNAQAHIDKRLTSSAFLCELCGSLRLCEKPELSLGEAVVHPKDAKVRKDRKEDSPTAAGCPL